MFLISLLNFHIFQCEAAASVWSDPAAQAALAAAGFDTSTSFTPAVSSFYPTTTTYNSPSQSFVGSSTFYPPTTTNNNPTYSLPGSTFYPTTTTYNSPSYATAPYNNDPAATYYESPFYPTTTTYNEPGPAGGSNYVFNGGDTVYPEFALYSGRGGGHEQHELAYQPQITNYDPQRYPPYPGHTPSSSGTNLAAIPVDSYGPTYSFFGRFDRLPPSSQNGPRDLWDQPTFEEDPYYAYKDPYANPFWESQVSFCSYRECSKFRCEQECGVGMCVTDNKMLGYKCNAFSVDRTHALSTPGFLPEVVAQPINNEPVLPSYNSELGWVQYPQLPVSAQWDCSVTSCDIRTCEERCDRSCVQTYPVRDGWNCPAPIPFFQFT